MTRVEWAAKRGADELMALVEYALRYRPRALKNARRYYRDCCLRLYRALERTR